MSRIDRLPPYLFVEIDAQKRRALAEGRDVVDLGIGDPDRPTPAALVDVMAAAVRDVAHHRYPAGAGSPRLRRAIAGWLRRRHGATVDPEDQVVVLIGSKEGLAHLPLALLEAGDRVLVPDPGYPVYAEAAILAGGEPVRYPLRAEDGFLPDPDRLAGLIDARTRLLVVNSPHNPTGALAGSDLWGRLLELTRARGLVLVNDGAYLEVVEGPDPARSLLAAADPASDRVLELHSLSKTFNMTGWRVAFAAGHPELVRALRRVKDSVDSGVFGAIQEVAVHALGPAFAELCGPVLSVYPPRRRLVAEALRTVGIEVFPARASFFVWARVPPGEDSLGFCRRVLREHDVVVTPGVGFGPGGEGWFRVSLTAPDERIAEAARRLGRL